VQNPAVWRALLGWAVERELVLLTTNEGGLTDAVGTLLQLRAQGVQSTLVHATSSLVCDAVYGVVPDGACVWTSWKPPGIVGEWEADNFRTILFVARKYIVSRLVAEGLGVLQTDTDTVWFVNPFALFNSPSLRPFDVIVQQDGPFANAGVLYVRNGRNGTGAGYVVQELLLTLQRFSGDPASILAAVREIIPQQAKRIAHKVENEQMGLNDVIASAVLGRRVWTSSLGRLYQAKGGVCPSASCDVKAKSGYSETFREVMKRSTRVPIDICTADPHRHMACASGGSRRAVEKGISLTIRDPGMPGNRGTPSKLLIAPPSLFSHLQSYRASVPLSWDQRCAAVKALRNTHRHRPAVEHLEAARRVAPVVAMLHLSALASAKFQRSVVIQALGIWDPRADAAGVRFGTPRLRGGMRVITLDNFDLRELVRQEDTATASELLARPLLRLALLSGRQPAASPLPCAKGAGGISNRRQRGPVDLIVPNSDCGDPVPGDSSRTPASECILFFRSAQCHEIVLSSMEFARLRANITSASSAELSELRMPLSLLGTNLNVPGSGSPSQKLALDIPSLAAKFREVLGKSKAQLVILDGGGMPLSKLDDALGKLPSFREGARALTSSAKASGEMLAAGSVPMLCRSLHRMKPWLKAA